MDHLLLVLAVIGYAFIPLAAQFATGYLIALASDSESEAWCNLNMMCEVFQQRLTQAWNPYVLLVNTLGYSESLHGKTAYQSLAVALWPLWLFDWLRATQITLDMIGPRRAG